MKFHLKMKHMELVKAGRYDVARLVLRFLQQGKICLGLGDTDWQVQQTFLLKTRA